MTLLKIKTTVITCLTVLSLTNTLYAQLPDEATTIINKYPNDFEVVLKKHQTTTIDIIDGDLKIFSDHYNETMILNDMAGGVEEEKLEYSGWSSIENLAASTQIPKGKKYKNIAVTDFKEKDELEGAIFYSDTRSINFHYTDLKKGAKKSLSFRKTTKEPRFLNGFIFVSHLPIEEAKFTIKCHKEVKINIKYLNTQESDFDYRSYEKKGYTYYEWTQKNIPKIEGEVGMPAVRYFIPHIEVWITSYTVNNEEKQLLGGVDQLYNWYSSLIKDVNTKPSPRLKEIADSITTDLSTDLEKVKRIYYWVQDNIKYVAYEAGLGGFVPREAKLVCDRRFGDCKDMASIITEMLDQIGIPANLTWIGSRDIPYKYTEVPTPSVDNHMIASYQNEGKTYWLDGTGRYNPFGLPTSFIQGKEAMINEGNGKYRIEEVPIPSPEVNQLYEKISLTIQDGKLRGVSKAQISGYFKVNFAYKYLSKTNEERSKYLHNYLNKGSNKFLLDDYTVKNIDNKDLNTEFDYSFNLADYVRTNNDEMYINLNLEKVLENTKLEKDRKYPYEIKFKNSRKYEISLTIPEGFQVEYLPENAEFKNDRFHYNITYRQSGGSVRLEFTVTQNFLMLQPQEFDDYNKMTKSLGEQYFETILLKKK